MRGRLRWVVVPRPSTPRHPLSSETIKYTRHHPHCHRFLVQRTRYIRVDRLRCRRSSLDFAFDSRRSLEIRRISDTPER